MAARFKRPEVIQRVMRHAKVSITIDRYVKVYRDTVRAAPSRSTLPSTTPAKGDAKMPRGFA
jgi:hypothetical protein